jgi:hypothetical protein
MTIVTKMERIFMLYRFLNTIEILLAKPQQYRKLVATERCYFCFAMIRA